MNVLGEDQKKQFQTDGYCVIPDFATPDEVKELLAQADSIVKGGACDARKVQHDPFPQSGKGSNAPTARSARRIAGVDFSKLSSVFSTRNQVRSSTHLHAVFLCNTASRPTSLSGGLTRSLSVPEQDY